MCNKRKQSLGWALFLLLMLTVKFKTEAKIQQRIIMSTNPPNKSFIQDGESQTQGDAPKHDSTLHDGYEKHYLWLMKQIITNNIYYPSPCVRDGKFFADTALFFHII